MVYYRLGDVIKELRERLHMTQEELAEGICSVSSVAKIEGGSQMPSGRVAEALFCRLKDSGSFFTGFAQAQELLELHDWEHLLARAKDGEKKGSRFEEQLYAYVRLIDQMQAVTDHSVLLFDLIQVLVMSMPLSELYDDSAERRTYTYLELCILNSIAVQFYYMESFEQAGHILQRVHDYLLKWHAQGEVGRYLFPAVCNNLAAVKMGGGLAQPARSLCDAGIRCCLDEGMLIPLPSLYGNLSNALSLQHEHTAAQKAYSRMKVLKELLLERPEDPGEHGTARPEIEAMKNDYLMSFIW